MRTEAPQCGACQLPTMHSRVSRRRLGGACRATPRSDSTERAASGDMDRLRGLTGPSLMVRLNSLHYIQDNVPQLQQIVQDRSARALRALRLSPCTPASSCTCHAAACLALVALHRVAAAERCAAWAGRSVPA